MKRNDWRWWEWAALACVMLAMAVIVAGCVPSPQTVAKSNGMPAFGLCALCVGLFAGFYLSVDPPMSRRKSEIIAMVTLFISLILVLSGCGTRPGVSPLSPSAAGAITAPAAGRPVLLAVDGNSLTQSRNGAESMPAALLDVLGHPANVTLVDAGQSGHSTSDMLLSAPALLDGLPRPGQANLLVVWEGGNDLYYGASVDLAYAHLETYCRARRAAGYQIILLTVTPRSHPLNPPTWDGDALALNALLRAGSGAWVDALVDVGADPVMGDPAAPLDGVYYSPLDHVHLTDAGAQRVAQLVAPIVRRFF